MPRRPWVALALLLPLLVTAEARRPRALRGNPRIVNGLYTFDHPETGALLRGSTVGSAELQCTGTLIGCSTFLTAAHCVSDDTNPSHYFVFLQHGPIVAVTSIESHPGYSFPVADVAVLTLAAPVTGITPSALNTTGTPAFGTPGTIVGFGRTGPGSDYGLKRKGEVVTGPCAPGISNTTSVCWEFTTPVGTPGDDSNTCNGDSGGPLFIDAGGPAIAGITSGGESLNCNAPDQSYDTNVDHYGLWISAMAGGDLGSTACGTLPPVGSAATNVEGFMGTLDGITSEGEHTFDVPPGTLELRVALNAIDDGSDFDLYVRAGSPPTTSTYDCQQASGNQYGACTFSTPAAGPWYVLVHRYTGDGPYQVTATRFGVDCTDPGNAGAACDDGNPCTAGDTCAAGTCTGPMLPNDTPCEDGSLCSPDDTCQGGVCFAAPGPATRCLVPAIGGRSSLQIRNAADDTRDRLKWKWVAGQATTLADFGDPLATTTYALCLYDRTGGTPSLVFERTVAPGDGWSSLGANGYRFADSSLAQGGMRTIRLQPGLDTRARITVDARTGVLAGTSLPLAQDPNVILQLVTPTQCWETTFSDALINNDVDFKARGD